MNGIINFLKPAGMTSHDLVSFVKKKFPQKKIGHTGTLDPAASGVLPICIGKATRISSFFLEGDKGYRAVIKLGIKTDTLDGQGEETGRSICDNLAYDDVKKVLSDFRGAIEQIPPAYSAVRFRGKKLYELARKGEMITLPSRTINITKLEMVDFKEGFFPEIIIDIVCSHGTYIRSLASEIGEKIGCGAHLAFLIRTFSGHFLLEDAVTLEAFENAVCNNKLNDIITEIDAAISFLPKVNVTEDALRFLLNGNKLYPHQVIVSADSPSDINEDLFRVYDLSGSFWGLGKFESEFEGRIFRITKLLREQREI